MGIGIGRAASDRLASDQVASDRMGVGCRVETAWNGLRLFLPLLTSCSCHGSAEAAPVGWSNSLGDGAIPPPFLYLRHCVMADVTCDWAAKPAKRCGGDGQHAGAPDGIRVGCNALCPPSSTERTMDLWSLQSGLRVRLEVFRRGEPVGWGLRSLDPISKHTLVMEYVGEHVSEAAADQRSDGEATPNVFLMDISCGRGRSSMNLIDALHARNASAFANFSCLPNMEKRPVLTQHWDTALPHAAFFATRQIEAGEELTYRRDERSGVKGARAQREIACLCRHHGCKGWV